LGSLFPQIKLSILSFGNLKPQRKQMANDNPASGGNSSNSRGNGPHLAQDGHRPFPLKEGYQPRLIAVTFPNKVQGGYQGPPGGGKPATPTTGSGVTTKPVSPPPGKK
jgi:hypothetical protein